MVVLNLTYDTAPRTLRDRVCWPSRCTGDTSVKEYEDRYGNYSPRHRPPVHFACGKPHFGAIYQCEREGNFFIRDFGDPRFCFCRPLCWDHLSELPPSSYCGTHSGDYLLDEVKFPRFGPVGLNPRSYSNDDLTAAMAELGLDIEL